MSSAVAAPMTTAGTHGAIAMPMCTTGKEVRMDGGSQRIRVSSRPKNGEMLDLAGWSRIAPDRPDITQSVTPQRYGAAFRARNAVVLATKRRLSAYRQSHVSRCFRAPNGPRPSGDKRARSESPASLGSTRSSESKRCAMDDRRQACRVDAMSKAGLALMRRRWWTLTAFLMLCAVTAQPNKREPPARPAVAESTKNPAASN